jgi:hypothetical protein
MISDTTEALSNIENNEDSLIINPNPNPNPNQNVVTGDIHTNNKITFTPLSKETHEKIYDFLIDEIKSCKQVALEKEQHIDFLNNKIEELTMQLNESHVKLNKMTNIGLLIKLKENLTNKQNEFESEINNINNGDNSCDSDTNKDDTKLEEKINVNLTMENAKSNIIIVEEFDKQTIKPKKRPNMFRRHF